MPDSKREAALKALAAALQTIPGPLVLRNPAAGVKIPAGGLVILRDGDQGEPEVYLSPPVFAYSHAAEVVVAAQGQDAAARDAMLDDLLQQIGAAIAANDTLGGAVEMAAISAVAIADEPFEGAAPVKAARFTVILDYQSSTPLG